MKTLLLSLCLLLQSQQHPLVVPVCPPPTTYDLACVQAANQQYQFELALIENAYAHDVNWHYEELMTAMAMCEQGTEEAYPSCIQAANYIYNVQMGQTQNLKVRLLKGAWEALGDALEACCE